MASAEFDMLDIEAAATYERKFKWRTASGEPVPMGQYRLHMRMEDCDGEVFLQYDTPFGDEWVPPEPPEPGDTPYASAGFLTYLSPEDGEFMLSISWADTVDVCKSGVYDLFAERRDGYQVKLLRGRFRVEKNVTQFFGAD